MTGMLAHELPGDGDVRVQLLVMETEDSPLANAGTREPFCGLRRLAVTLECGECCRAETLFVS